LRIKNEQPRGRERASREVQSVAMSLVGDHDGRFAQLNAFCDEMPQLFEQAVVIVIEAHEMSLPRGRRDFWSGWQTGGRHVGRFCLLAENVKDSTFAL